MRITFVASSILIASSVALITAFGCAHVISLPPQATLAEIEPSGRAAKAPDCAMPVLRREPLTDFRKVAIVEGTGNVYASEADVLPVVQRKAITCDLCASLDGQPSCVYACPHDAAHRMSGEELLQQVGTER